jgi:hypothetical protein
MLDPPEMRVLADSGPRTWPSSRGTSVAMKENTSFSLGFHRARDVATGPARRARALSTEVMT